jgi:hypothetical protein
MQVGVERFLSVILLQRIPNGRNSLHLRAGVENLISGC